ncbi:DMT family transporter [Nocardia seriolae]|uniref:Multidrug resistance protein Mmr n=1 Tax=Nocardia seriolae TaxID=37332 RepID=A0A0B8NRE5_9NOCA|nr:multidrug efflux SMR transporter [Nocardia seriolae]MTJ63490.1 QacE family quaternary ammonium compound efflux SMR transporter [Nocardia seriolae]MTJ76394.1 QacE family quaternary ammonium compound efflux SMR transporter [Nocardia seriolae]MTJ88711.1 QacE family quaternary ammonium compound efflux SMR transporter [Nocardia seriolae]MTK32690.1 QacE family quaternary ammonium compound efflux SMR transporter [Nocardia seriolae]MTK41389.1 QacE family quaternary ammonium compound efflux SMR tran
MSWIYLRVAAVFEIAFALGTNATKGFTRLWPSVFTLLAAAGGIFTLSLALRTLDVGVGYTIWTGIGSIGTVVLGALIYKEKITVAKLVAFASIIAGAVVLRLAAGA